MNDTINDRRWIRYGRYSWRPALLAAETQCDVENFTDRSNIAVGARAEPRFCSAIRGEEVALIAQRPANITDTISRVDLANHRRRRIRRRHRVRRELNSNRLTCGGTTRLDTGGPAQDGCEDQRVGRAERKQHAAIDNVAVPGRLLSQPEPEQSSAVVPAGSRLRAQPRLDCLRGHAGFGRKALQRNRSALGQ